SEYAEEDERPTADVEHALPSLGPRPHLPVPANRLTAPRLGRHSGPLRGRRAPAGRRGAGLSAIPPPAAGGRRAGRSTVPEPTMRDRARRIVESGWFQNGVIALILINAVSLGLETYEELFAAAPEVFSVTETVFVGLFAAELALKVFAYGRSFFRDPWNWFDAIVVGIALVPSSSGFSVLRLLRILRILRLVSAVPQMRQIIGALFRSVPGMSTVIGLLLITVYTAAVLAEKLFEDVSPHYFGDLHTSLYTMFMVLTTENWPDIAESVTEQRPW